MFTLIRAFCDIFFGKRPEGYEYPYNVKHYALALDEKSLNEYGDEYRALIFFPTHAHNDIDFDEMVIYLSNKILKNYLCLVEITALECGGGSEENDDWWKKGFPYEHYEFLKKCELDKGIFFNGRDKIACLKNGIDIHFIDKFFWYDNETYTIYFFLLEGENENISNYKDIDNIINNKQFNVCIELFRHGSCLYLDYKADAFASEDIIAAFSDVCLKFGKELDVRI